MIDVRPAEGERDFRIMFSLLMLQHHEVGRGGFNPEKVGAEVYRAMQEGVAYIIERDGQPIGTAGLVITTLWYSDDRYWAENWLFIAPPMRTGKVFRRLLDELRTLANETGLPVCFTVFNETRFNKKAGIARIAEHFAFSPAGVDVQINPADEDERS